MLQAVNNKPVYTDFDTGTGPSRETPGLTLTESSPELMAPFMDDYLDLYRQKPVKKQTEDYLFDKGEQGNTEVASEYPLTPFQ